MCVILHVFLIILLYNLCHNLFYCLYCRYKNTHTSISGLNVMPTGVMWWHNSNKTLSGIVDQHDSSAESNTTTMLNKAGPPGWSITQDEWGYESAPIFVLCVLICSHTIQQLGTGFYWKGLHQQAKGIINFSHSLECFHFIFICLPFSLSIPTFAR